MCSLFHISLRCVFQVLQIRTMCLFVWTWTHDSKSFYLNATIKAVKRFCYTTFVYVYSSADLWQTWLFSAMHITFDYIYVEHCVLWSYYLKVSSDICWRLHYVFYFSVHVKVVHQFFFSFSELIQRSVKRTCLPSDFERERKKTTRIIWRTRKNKVLMFERKNV